MSDEAMKEKIINKIRRLLALAGSSNEHEAESAMLKAQQLMVENGLSMQQVGPDQLQKKEVSWEGTNKFRRMPWWHRRLSPIIADNFRCFSITSSKNGVKWINFVGLKNDAEIAREVFSYAVDFLEHKISTLYKEIRGDIPGYRKAINMVVNDYLVGFMDGLSQKFKEQVKQQEWGLVLVKDEEVEKAVEDIKDDNPKKADRAYSDLYYDGYADGKSFEVTKGLLETGAG